ncbi:hypothetical protein ASPFODRAFT_47669 [Aspergillus luchuensis CBS 106.47]|uniref:Aminoglycoside phosphotransferase domain-containing protein n=1 Tax=Aspergillus luchuensis (strain CBS 106.47) TaxID=1137211 RepID=A0A1M3TEF3_ASPLC|nr:hypothetical protein ASPFODRAFT_47669 [Aspergillus luchuensis CBS 106.47]
MADTASPSHRLYLAKQHPSSPKRPEEVLSVKVARQAGLPVPKVVCYGDHPDTPHAPVPILMTRVPGKQLGEAYKALNDEEKNSITRQLDLYLKTVRKWKRPWGEKRICSLVGTPIRSTRVPDHRIGPFETEKDSNEYLIEPAWPGEFRSKWGYKEALHLARKMQGISHPIVFTHGDLQYCNIKVQDGRITGLSDWGAVGWYYLILPVGGMDYMLKLEVARALTSLTSESCTW